MTRPFRVLSLDGGGVRGLYTATLLDELAQLFGDHDRYPDVGKGFDLIVGTSTGGIIGAGLAIGLSPRRIMEIYRRKGREIFSDPVPSGKGWKRWALRHRSSAGNSQVPLASALREVLGTVSLGELYTSRGIALCLTAVRMAAHGPRVFKTPHLGRLRLDVDVSVVDACLATSAAPIVLPLASITHSADPTQAEMFVDGGLWANNPVLVALVEALELAASDQPIEILSLGTCAPPGGHTLAVGDADWGLERWKAGVGVVETSLDAQSEAHGHIASFLTQHLNRRCRIVRLQPGAAAARHAGSVGMDDASEESLRLLVSHAREEARALFGRATRSADEEARVVGSLFQEMPPLATEPDDDTTAADADVPASPGRRCRVRLPRRSQ